MTASTRPLGGKRAMVTGSTSGIGLGIARALAEAGADVTLNGFGDPKEIASLRTRVAADYGVNTARWTKCSRQPKQSSSFHRPCHR